MSKKSTNESIELAEQQNELIEKNEKQFLNDSYEQLDDIKCGLGCLQYDWLQRYANKNAYVFVYGFLGCLFSAAYAYFNGTLTMIEKRFKIPSQTTGIISVGNDISSLFLSAVISYYGGYGHRPRWIAFGLFLIATFCLISALPQFIYGSGELALLLTQEYALADNYTATDTLGTNNNNQNQFLCQLNRTSNECQANSLVPLENNFAPQIILFIAQLISGVGGSLYHTLGVSYMDDNIKKSKTPALISISYFIRLLGPAFGYALASACLKIYISPYLTPIIDQRDSRWLGAWWLGWLILSIPIYLLSILMAMFPKELPESYMRKQKLKQQQIENNNKQQIPNVEKKPEVVSFGNMMRTFKRLLTNKTFMCNNMASVFYCLGFMPYWIFLPKYIETQYKQTASVSSLTTGMIGLVFSAIGILISGIVISKYKPSARALAVWNIIVGAVDVIGICIYPFLGCDENDNNLKMSFELNKTCNMDCNCDFVKYSPVCSYNTPVSEQNTFISACHAGCTGQYILFPENATKMFTNCSCISSGLAISGACPVDCTTIFYIFLSVVCLIKFTGASGRASNFLVSVRCVDEVDKPSAMGFGIMILSLLAFIPSPILFGSILDKTCLVWGKTCSGSGNCWLYDSEQLRYVMNFTAATFIIIGVLFDCAVWYYVKHLKIFDDPEEKPTNIDDVDK
ncbi:solute carrier organic anion transporter family member 74D [Chrysoperla carnea]|uniref:solute carrier organic anion transporter family member 74D n=1 Tax=Chrysoperla carnea TaxID=189513 RepID=UPI001D06984E|nr:solute carrier organic anion transporter family member 74D [Chrysoperla carnea]